MKLKKLKSLPAAFTRCRLVHVKSSESESVQIIERSDELLRFKFHFGMYNTDYSSNLSSISSKSDEVETERICSNPHGHYQIW